MKLHTNVANKTMCFLSLITDLTDSSDSSADNLRSERKDGKQWACML